MLTGIIDISALQPTAAAGAPRARARRSAWRSPRAVTSGGHAAGHRPSLGWAVAVTALRRPPGRGPPADRADRARHADGRADPPPRGQAARRRCHRGAGRAGASVGGPGGVGVTGPARRRSARPIVSMSLRAWPRDFPTDIATQRRAPYESRADSVMYRQVLAGSHARTAGRSTCTTPRMWRTGRSPSSASGPTRCSAARGRRSGRPCDQGPPAWRSRRDPPVADRRPQM